MTVTAQANRISYAGNGSTTAFAFPYKFLAQADLVVVLVNDTTGVETAQIITTHYTVSGEGTDSSGQVTMVTPPASGESLVIYSDPSILQGTDFINGDGFDLENVEAALDELTLLVRRADDLKNRSLRQPEGDTTDFDFVPSKVDRASKYLAFDADGQAVASTGTGSTYAATDYALTLLDDDDAEEARSTLLVGKVITPEQHGAVGGGTTDDTTAMQAAIGALQPYDILWLSNVYRVTGTGLEVRDKSNIRITGNGAIYLNNSGAQSYALQLIGTCTNVEIDGLTIYGDGLSAAGKFQYGIGNPDSDTFKGIHIHDLTLYDLNMAILVGNPVGSYTAARIHDNYIYDIVGVNSGQGYGIALNGSDYSSAYDNIIGNCSRHALYISNGSHQRIYGNYIYDHRADVADASTRSAISIARVEHSACFDNTLYNCFDAGLGVEAVPVDSANCTYVDVHHNKFLFRGNNVFDVYIGSQESPPSSTYTTSHVNFHDNIFISDNAVATSPGDPSMIIHNGHEISVRNNTWVTTNVDERARHITVGHSTYIGSAAECTNVEVLDNIHQFFGSDTSDTRAITLDVDVSATYTPTIHVGRLRQAVGVNEDISLDGSHTNTNCVIENPVGVRIGVYAAADATPSVKGINRLRITNGSAQDITSLDDMEDGQIVYISVTDGNTTFKNSGFYLTSNLDFNLGVNDELAIQKVGANLKEVSRMEF